MVAQIRAIPPLRHKAQSLNLSLFVAAQNRAQ
jgi:hypothetical protein